MVNIYPKLIAFLKTWLKSSETGNIKISELTHPLQLGFSIKDLNANVILADNWVRLTSSRNPFLLSLLCRETSELLQISHWVKREEDRDWLEKTRDQLKALISSLWNDKNGTYSTPDLSSEQEHPGVILACFEDTDFPG